MSNVDSKNILVMAGGTGGHIFPALAVARELETKGANIFWLGSKGGMEQELIEREAIPMHLLPISGVRGKGILSMFVAPFKLLSCVWQARKFIKKDRIDLVVGFGGFASAPGGFASAISGVPLVIHEQNAIAGLTNRLLSRLAKKVCQAFEGAFESSPKVVTTGNPIRHELIDLASTKAVKSQAPINVLVVGGSRGAQAFNQTLPGLFKDFINSGKILVNHQCGRGNSEAVKSAYATMGVSTVEVNEFIDDMNQAYNWADLVVCRAGALTVSELAAIGLPAIFIPYPFAVDDHQTKNAEVLKNARAAWIVNQDSMEEVKSHIESIFNDSELLLLMAQRSKEKGIRDATQSVASICLKLI